MGGAFKNEQFVHYKAFALNKRPINKDILKLCILWAEQLKTWERVIKKHLLCDWLDINQHSIWSSLAN